MKMNEDEVSGIIIPMFPLRILDSNDHFQLGFHNFSKSKTNNIHIIINTKWLFFREFCLGD